MIPFFDMTKLSIVSWRNKIDLTFYFQLVKYLFNEVYTRGIFIFSIQPCNTVKNSGFTNSFYLEIFVFILGTYARRDAFLKTVLQKFPIKMSIFNVSRI